MAYATLAAVQKLMPGDMILGSGTDPSASDAEAMIVDTTNQIDAAFGTAGTTLPITDSKVLGLLGIRAAREVAYQCMTVRGVYATDQQPPLWTKWHTEFEEMLKGIAKGDIVDTAIVGGGVPWGYTMDSTPGDGTQADAKIQRGQEW